MDNIFAHDDL